MKSKSKTAKNRNACRKTKRSFAGPSGYVATGAQLGSVMILEYRMEKLARVLEEAGRELWAIHHELHDIRDEIRATNPDT